MTWQLPELSEHTVAPPALQPLADAAGIEERINRACVEAMPQPRTLAALGNIMLRRGAYLDALEAYRSASDADTSDAALAWMTGEIAHVLDSSDTSLAYRTRALALQRAYCDPLPVGSRTPVLLLLRDAPYSDNTPLELLLDRSRVAVHKYYVEGDSVPDLPQADVVMTAFGFAHAGMRAIERAAALSPSINDPRKLPRIAREAVSQWAQHIDGLVAPAVTVVSADELAAVAFPATMRPLDTHAGKGFALMTGPDDAEHHARRFPARSYYVAPFIDYSSRDGFYRKFRAIFVDGKPFPYHYAVSLDWMVHYQSAPMQHIAGFREEEALFLQAPQAVVPQWERVMGEIARAVELEYFGIDGAVLEDGRIVLFEADAAMLVHDEDPGGIFAYKRPYVARIREALHALIERRRQRRTP